MTAREEIALNNTKIAELKQRLAQLESGASGNALDMRLAANRAAAGDFGNAQAHLGRIETRNQWERSKALTEKMQAAQKLSDAEYTLAQLDNKVQAAKTELAYTSPDNTRALKQMEENVRAAEAQRDAFIKKNPLLASRIGNATQKQETPRQEIPAGSNSIQGAKQLFEEMTFEGADGKSYWKEGVDPEKYWDYRAGIPYAGENEELRKFDREVRRTTTVPEKVSKNTIENAQAFIGNIENFRNNKFTSTEAKQKFKKMLDELPDEVKQSKEYNNLLAFTRKMDPVEYRSHLKKLHREGEAAFKEAFEDNATLGEKAKKDGKFSWKGVEWKWSDKRNGWEH